jgi:hypothetical protein
MVAQTRDSVAYDTNNHFGPQEGRGNDSLYSKRVKAGKRRTYFFDVRETRGQDYFITITESKKRFEDGTYERHKMFLYKEDFNKFLAALTETINYVKTDLMPNFDFDAYNHDLETEEGFNNGAGFAINTAAVPTVNPNALPIQPTVADEGAEPWTI